MPGTFLGVEYAAGELYDLSAYRCPTFRTETFGSMESLLQHPDPVAALQEVRKNELRPLPKKLAFLPPCDTQEVWAAGVTYMRSKVARMEESKNAGGEVFYDRVYEAERPELFFKSAAWRVCGIEEPVRIRKDSAWNVPEPELTLAVSSTGEIVAACVGNDMSSRTIEGENPLYLPQAKIYDGACALGHGMRICDGTFDLGALDIFLDIYRGGQLVQELETNTRQMRRKPQELVDWLFRDLSHPKGVFLMTGTGLIPPDGFTLKSGDTVRVTIDEVGFLENPVE